MNGDSVSPTHSWTTVWMSGFMEKVAIFLLFEVVFLDRVDLISLHNRTRKLNKRCLSNYADFSFFFFPC